MGKKAVYTLLLAITMISVTHLSLCAQTIRWNEGCDSTFVFEVTDKEALTFLKKGSNETVMQSLLYNHVATFDDDWENKPVQGHFIYANIHRNVISYTYVPVIPFQVFLFNEYGMLTLQVIDGKGEVRTDAKVRIQGGAWRLFDLQVTYDKASKTYRINDSSENTSRILTVQLDGFKAIFDLSKNIVRPYYDSDGGWGESDDRPNFYSYMITDKNKYRPGDKVRFKSYALTSGKRPIKDSLTLFIQNADRYDFKPVMKVGAYNPGGFAGEINLDDSLKLRLDRNYKLRLVDKRERVVAQTSFRYEDYVLYDNKIETKIKDYIQYYPNDNEVEIKVVDANNLIMPDLQAQVTITRQSVWKSYADLLVMPDIIKSEVVNLAGDEATTYKIPASLFDKTDGSYSIEISVLTPDGQVLRDAYTTSFYKYRYEIDYTTQDSTIVFGFKELGVEKEVPAKISTDGSEWQDVTLPHAEILAQNAKKYTVFVPYNDTLKIVPQNSITQEIAVNGIDPKLNIKGGFVKDSLVLGFVNPLRLDVTWFLYEGNRLLEKGFGKDIDFKTQLTDLDVCYFFEAFFTLGGDNQVYRKVFVPKEEFLNIEWNMPDRIYPGQAIGSKIKITDSRGREVKGVDITAFAYNSLLNYEPADLPYYGNTPRGREERDSYEIVEKYANYNLNLTQGNYQFWNKIAHLDENPYYCFTFPNTKRDDNLPHAYQTDTPDGTTEFAPFVMRDGNAVKIYAIEVDDKPIYFSWAQQPKAYSFLMDTATWHTDMHKIALRLYDRIIIIHNFHPQEGKKTIFSVNLDDMPSNSSVTQVMMHTVNKGTKKHPNYVYQLNRNEQERYINHISEIPIIEDRFTYLTHITAADTILVPVYHPSFNADKRSGYYNSNREQTRIVGPLDSGMYRYMDGVEYFHEGGYKYKYDKNVVYKFPDNPFPYSLTPDRSNDLSMVNDFCFTPRQWARTMGMIDPKQEAWNPIVITLTNTKIHVPEDKEKSGLRGIIMRNRATGKLFVPVFDRAILGMHGDDGMYGLKGMTNGRYDIFALFANGNYLRYDDVPLNINSYVELKMDSCVEFSKDSLSAEWLDYHPYGTANVPIRYEPTPSVSYSDIGKSYFNPANDVRGTVVDSTGEPIFVCSVYVKGSTAGTLTDIDGNFIIDLQGSKNTLVFSFIGFKTQEIEVNRGTTINVRLEEDDVHLDEVVVTGYGSVRRETLMSMVRGISVDEPPSSYEDEEFEETNTKDGSDKLYNELLQLDGMRSNFNDVGFWQPALVTDKTGEADFTVTFPDNITKWQAVVYAMNRRLQTGMLRRYINSYKPVMAEIRTPQFLVAGDRSVFSTNIRNYTKDNNIAGNIIFVNNGDSIFIEPVNFAASYRRYISVTAPAEQDSLTFSYRFTRGDDYSDGEQRSISIEKRGTETADGTLQFIKNGDNISVAAAPDEQVEISVTNSSIDIYMNVANDLMGYRYACNEQLASKLIGLLNYKLYMQYCEKPFKYDKKVNEIINRLLKNRNSGKLWSWWNSADNTSYWMSAHVLRALDMARKTGYVVSLDISKVKYDYMDVHNLRTYNVLYDIDVFNALVDWGTEQSYKEAIEMFETKITAAETREDSLVAKYRRTKNPKDYAVRHSYLTQRLTLAEMRQKLGLPYDRTLITSRLDKDVLGAVRLKDTLQYYYWYYNNEAANVIAYRIVRRDSVLRRYMLPMQMHILSTKRYGWNTYQASSALMTILPDLLSASTTKSIPATITLNGKENKTVTEFPYNATLHGGERLMVNKTSGMPLIYSAYTMKWRTLKHDGEAFDISTALSDSVLLKGVPVTLTVRVNVKQDNAEHVMIEIPVPAGCDYQSKERNYYDEETYREYFKERTAIFCERLPKGTYTYTINLMPRYSGRYTLNPAKVEMMYFPVINANNEIKKVYIK